MPLLPPFLGGCGTDEPDETHQNGHDGHPPPGQAVRADAEGDRHAKRKAAPEAQARKAQPSEYAKNEPGPHRPEGNRRGASKTEKDTKCVFRASPRARGLKKGTRCAFFQQIHSFSLSLSLSYTGQKQHPAVRCAASCS